jgi:hypothetical protein
MKLAWACAGALVAGAVIYYAVKPVTRVTFYDPDVIRVDGTSVKDPPTVISADDVDSVT